MTWEDTSFEDSEDSEFYDEELDEILGKIDEITDSEEEDQQQELISLCDLAIERVGLSQPDNIELYDFLYWTAGYACLELAEDDMPIERGLNYINLIRNRFAQWHLAYARIHFYRENFKATIEHLDLLEKAVNKSIKNKALDRDTVQMFRQICAIGRMRTYLATGEVEKYEACVSKYLTLILKNGVLTGLNHFVVAQDFIRFVSNMNHLNSLLAIEDTFGAMLGMKEIINSQICFLQGDVLESNRYAYYAKRRVTEGDEFDSDLWETFLDDEKDTTTPNFSIGAFECLSLDSPPGIYCLMESRATQYLSDNMNAQDAYHDNEIRLIFPIKISEFGFEGQQFYEGDGLGYSLRYSDENIVRIDIYVYDKAYSDLEEGINSQEVLTEFDEFYSMINYMQTQGDYINALELNSGEKTFKSKAIRFLWSQFQYEILPAENVQFFGEVISNIFLTTYNGKFVKVRLTLKKNEHNELEEDIEAFMTAFSMFLENSRQ